VQVDGARSPLSRRTVFERLRAAGIGVNVHYIPVNLQPDYAGLGFGPGQFPNAETYYARCVSLPMFAGLSDADQQTVIRELGKALS
jgi:dTDP-4-amino-4,6-dideoxygalactose transaminase